MEMMNALAVAQMIGGTIVSGDQTIEVISGAIDSRNVQINSIFFAIPGHNSDGHSYINDAVNAGAKIIIIEKKLEEINIDENAKKATFIKVISSMRALASLASAYRSKFDIPVVGITGSVGKTTTKEMVYSVLSAKYNTLKSEGNYNSETGLPLSILNLNKNFQTAVFEMGMDQMGEIDFLTRIARPYIGIITNIGVSHIEILGSQKNILRAKLEIENGLMDDGTMILNADDEYLYSVKNNLKHPIIYYGIDNINAEYRAENIVINDKSTEFNVITPYGNFSAKIKVMGKHNVYNALAAIVTGFLLGLDINEIQKGLLLFENAKMRQNIYSFSDIIIMEDCYNASPDSMRAALDVIDKIEANHKIGLLADMLELGKKSPEFHYQIGMIAAKILDYLICYGELSEYIVKGAIDAGLSSEKALFFTDKEKAVEKLLEITKEKDIILFKASRGMKAEECLKLFMKRWTSKCQ